jgi:hypothetical protein
VGAWPQQRQGAARRPSLLLALASAAEAAAARAFESLQASRAAAQAGSAVRVSNQRARWGVASEARTFFHVGQAAR